MVRMFRLGNRTLLLQINLIACACIYIVDCGLWIVDVYFKKIDLNDLHNDNQTHPDNRQHTSRQQP
jgi:hypothetical protein